MLAAGVLWLPFDGCYAAYLCVDMAGLGVRRFPFESVIVERLDPILRSRTL
jgi:hypothetical protein